MSMGSRGPGGVHGAKPRGANHEMQPPIRPSARSRGNDRSRRQCWRCCYALCKQTRDARLHRRSSKVADNSHPLLPQPSAGDSKRSRIEVGRGRGPRNPRRGFEVIHLGGSNWRLMGEAAPRMDPCLKDCCTCTPFCRSVVIDTQSISDLIEWIKEILFYMIFYSF